MSAPGIPAAAVRPSTLRERVLRAGGWSLGGYAFGQVLRFATNLLMTRLLAPEMYGVMAVATMILVGLALFSDFGLRQAVVHSRRGSDPVYLNTVWVMKIGIGALVASSAGCVALALVAAGSIGVLPAGTVYAEPSLPYVVAALGLGPLIAGFDSTKPMEASRNLALTRLVQMQVLAQIAGLAVMLAAAMHHRSIWVLVSGALAATAASTLLSHIWLPGTRNRFRWDRNAFREVIGFGKWVLLSSALGFVASIADKGLLAAIVSAPAMGVYSIATMLLSAVDQVMSKMIGDVAFPAISEVVRQRRADLPKTVYKFHTPVSIVAGGCAGLLLTLAPELVSFLYDDRYHNAGWMLQILAISLTVLPARVHVAAFLSLGRSRLQFNLTAFHIVAMWSCIPLGVYFLGMEGALWAISFVHVAGIPVVLWWATREYPLVIGRELVVVAGVLAGHAIGTIAKTSLAL